MGFLDEIKKLTRPYDDEDEFFESEEGAPAPEEAPAAPPEKKSSFFSENSGEGGSYGIPPRTAFHAPARKEREPKTDSRVVNIGASQQKVVLVKPELFEAAADIADHLRDRRTVVMNLEAADKITARRLIDFLSGVAYAQDGKLKKVSANIFLIMPCNVDLMGDLADEIENSSLYF